MNAPPCPRGRIPHPCRRIIEPGLAGKHDLRLKELFSQRHGSGLEQGHLSKLLTHQKIINRLFLLNSHDPYGHLDESNINVVDLPAKQ